MKPPDYLETIKYRTRDSSIDEVTDGIWDSISTYSRSEISLNLHPIFDALLVNIGWNGIPVD